MLIWALCLLVIKTFQIWAAWDVIIEKNIVVFAKNLKNITNDITKMG